MTSNLKVINEQGNYDRRNKTGNMTCKFRVYFCNYEVSSVIIILVCVLELTDEQKPFVIQ